MLSKKTIELCIEKLDEEYKKAQRIINNNETWMAQRGYILYNYEHALYELKTELQNIEEECLND